MTAVTIIAEITYPTTHPAEPDTLINCPVFVKMPVPTVPENAIPEERIRIGWDWTRMRTLRD